uniref:Uncharacterized protein n=1 Tax=Bactrocera dorsalis TaxID=27457 RepID=A0A034W2R8_BACDO
MAGVFIHKYFAALLMVISLVCTYADDTKDLEIDMETLASRNKLLNDMFEDSLAINSYVFARSEEMCQKLIHARIHKYETSIEPETRAWMLSDCTIRVVERLDPSASRRGNHPDDILLREYGFDEIRKIVDQKHEDFYKEIVQRIDNYVNGLTPEQQRKKTARNLKKWSRKIKNARNLSKKVIAFGKCMRFYYFERGV